MAAPLPRKAVDLLVDHMNKTKKTNSKFGGAALHEPDERVVRMALSYVDVFGYLQNALAGWKDINIGDIIDAIKQFQGFFGIKKSGNLDIQTVRAMQMPRCGCPDIVRERHTGFAALKQFATTNLPRWTKTGITYQIADYITTIDKATFETAVYNAFQDWTQYVNFDVRPAKAGETPDIVIGTGAGPQSNFDGPGGILAWCYLPDGNDQQIAMKYDSAETWITDPAQRGILVQNVSCHEFGHSLGLSHSKIGTALMAPYYATAIAVPQQSDDIPRLIARYGARTDQPDVPTPTKPVIAITGDCTVTINGRNVS